MTNKPFLNSYWVIPDKFLAGEYPYNPGAKDPTAKLESLIKYGFNVFIDLTEEDELGPYNKVLNSLNSDVEHCRFPIEDRSITDNESMMEIQDKIATSLVNDKKVYVHCYGGIGRTGLVVGCWLANKHKDGELALEKLKTLWDDNPKSKWTTSPETDDQKEFVRNWKQC